MTAPDIVGHISYFCLLSGYFLLGRKNRWGFVLGAIGSVGWLANGFLLDMSSPIIWNVGFVLINLRGWFRWKKNSGAIDL